MNTIWFDNAICYDGTQLCSHWIYNETEILGDCMASFIGGAKVPIEHMVDLVDVKKNLPIFSKSMLHFIVELFHCDLGLAIAHQRLIAGITADKIRAAAKCPDLVRKGDDIYDGEKKVSVSIATASPVSCLIHFALNIESEGTPVPTKGLKDFEIDPKWLANEIMRSYSLECTSMNEARCKVRAVK